MILVINPGSSSFKYKLFDGKKVIKSNSFCFDLKNVTRSLKKSVFIMKQEIVDYVNNIEKIGIRVVHGGTNTKRFLKINKDVTEIIKKYSSQAPLHNPISLKIISLIEKDKLLENKIYAVFDNAFFSTLPEENCVYAIPYEISKKYEIRRFGFHGISHNYVAKKVDPLNIKNVISIHLGAGSSICAIKNGKAIDISMGMTPDEGLIMQTRCGDIDCGAVLYLVSKLGFKKTKRILENSSGLSGLTGTNGDMRYVLYLADEKLENVDIKINFNKNAESIKNAKLALKMYITKIKKYIGAYTALLGGVDVIVFTGNIGANSTVIKNRILEGLDFINYKKVEVIKPDEEFAIYQELLK